ncbi:MAG: gfo/Idh/MocA family oxidoreductase [Actinobacteria bacterium]|nr:gfo/Idh/MocA family oxidoreductase [Actinomycetota bacterium]
MRLGILGAGGFARFMREEIRRVPDIDVVAVASRSNERANEFDVPHIFDDYEKMLTSGEIDAVYNALSNDLHFPWTMAAVAHGLPVLCEKPMGVRAEEVALMLDGAQAAGVPVMEGYWQLFHPKFALVRSLIDSDAIGQVLHINAGFTHMWDFGGNFRSTTERGGGMLLDLGCYPMSTALWLREGAHPISATCLSWNGSVDNADMHVEASVTLSDDTTLTFTASAQRDPRRWFEVVGTEGTLKVSEPAFSHHPEAGDGTHVVLDDDDGEQQWHVPASDPRQLMLQHFVEVVAGSHGPAISAHLSLMTAHGLDLVRNSAQSL